MICTKNGVKAALYNISNKQGVLYLKETSGYVHAVTVYLKDASPVHESILQLY